MADINSSDLVGGGGSELKLATDVGGLAARLNSVTSLVPISSIDGSTGFTTALSLTGKYAISYLSFLNMTNESCNCRLTVDDQIIYNDNESVVFSSWTIFGNSGNPASSASLTQPYNTSSVPYFVCESSLLLEIQTTTDTDITLYYRAIPIS